MTRLEQLRLDAHLTVQELADATGVPMRTLYRIEAGTEPRVKTLARLSAFFGVPASEIIREATPITEKAA